MHHTLYKVLTTVARVRRVGASVFARLRLPRGAMGRNPKKRESSSALTATVGRPDPVTRTQRLPASISANEENAIADTVNEFHHCDR